MAKKTTRKYRQARAAAKPAAKAAFPGKVKAGRRDPMAKYSAEDREVFKELEKESKRGYITDDRGNKVYVKPEETAKERIAREREAAMRKYREQVEAEDGPKQTEKKTATATEKKSTKKAAPKKKAAAKPAAKKVGMTRAEKSAANKAAWARMTPAERKNWKETKTTVKPEAKPKAKPKVKKNSVSKVTRPTDASLTAQEDAYINQTREKLIKQGKLSGSKEVAIRPKGEVVSTRAEAKPVPPKKKFAAVAGKQKFRRTKAAAKGGAALALAGEVVSMAKGSTNKDIKEVVRLENKLGNITGKKDGAVKTFLKGAGLEAGQLANLATMGVVGKTRRQRMDELNTLIAKAEAKKAKQNKGLRYGKMGESLVPGTKAYKKGSKTRPGAAASAGGASSGGQSGGKSGGAAGATPGAGGSTITVTPGSTYVVKKGDTLSAIAKSAGVSLAEIRKANKKFATNPKYKQGSMIWSGTKVNIPKKQVTKCQ